jgi:hypothetical protein
MRDLAPSIFKIPVMRAKPVNAFVKSFFAFVIGCVSFVSIAHAQLAASYIAQPHHNSKWLVVENNKYQTVDYDANSIDYYDNINPQIYFPRESNFRGVIERLKYRNSTPTNGPDADARVELDMFNCNNGTSAPIWVEISFRGYLIGPRIMSSEAQLRGGFNPVVTQSFPAGDWPDKIYHAVCATKIDSQKNDKYDDKKPEYADSSYDWDHDTGMANIESDIGDVITECKVTRGQAKREIEIFSKKLKRERLDGKDPTNGHGGNSLWAVGFTCK